MFVRRITIVNVRRPKEQSLNDELQWFGSALGLLGERDRDKSRFRIFIELIKTLKEETNGLTSDQLAEKLSLSRATVVHHLNSLMEHGVVIHEGSRYVMRSQGLSSLVDDIKQDMERSLAELKKTAEELDKILDL